MSDHNWEKIETIIDDVLRLPENERATYIDKKCGDNDSLKNEITNLLDSIFESEGWLENPETYIRYIYDEISGDVHIPADDDSLVGEEIGPYTLLEKIGKGGMGVVFLAERTDGEFEHQVAVKIIRQGHSSPENILRFKQEQQILAGLNHPGIARLFDGGVTKEGFPFIIMEYVDGTPIDEYCRSRNCTVEEKIALFIQTLEAVRHAHENLVVHRDLKPGNILVTGSGDVKVLDFGISKLLEEENSVQITKTGNRILTLRYAAPEQITQANITTATDLYSLGVLFYELLANSSPYDLENKTRFDSEQIILKDEPQKPSQNASPPGLKKKLTGDLDAIALKAIRKEPGERYRVANEFLKDLRNYKKGLPITAREDSVQYRTKKFFQRHRQGIGFAAGIAGLIVFFVVFYTWNITQERNLAQMETERAEEVTEFLVDLFQSNNPEQTLGEDMPVSTVLEQGIERLSEADLSPENRATLLGTIAQIKIKLGNHGEAEDLLEQAMLLVTDSLTVQNKNTAAIATVNGQLATIRGDYDRAEKSFQIADSLFKSNYITQNKEYINLQFNWVNSYNEQSDYESSLHILNRMNPNQFGSGRDGMETRSHYYNYKAIVLKNLARYTEAIRNYNEALEIRKEVYGPENPLTATLYHNIANLYLETNEYEKALPLSRKAYDIREEIFGTDHLFTASTMVSLCLIYKKLGEFDQALEYGEKAARAHENSVGTDHIRYAMTIRYIADVHRLMGNFDKSKKQLDLASGIVREVYPSNFTFNGYIDAAYSELYAAMNEFEEAETYFERAFQNLRKGLGENHPSVGEILVNYGKMEIERDQYKKAKKLLLQASNNYSQHFDETDSEILEVKSMLDQIGSAQI